MRTLHIRHATARAEGSRTGKKVDQARLRRNRRARVEALRQALVTSR